MIINTFKRSLHPYIVCMMGDPIWINFSEILNFVTQERLEAVFQKELETQGIKDIHILPYDGNLDKNYFVTVLIKSDVFKTPTTLKKYRVEGTNTIVERANDVVLGSMAQHQICKQLAVKLCERLKNLWVKEGVAYYIMVGIPLVTDWSADRSEFAFWGNLYLQKYEGAYIKQMPVH